MNTSNSLTSMAIAWSGLPPYAAYCIRDLIEKSSIPIVVIGSKPDVPHKGLESILGCDVFWVNTQSPLSWKQLSLDCPSLFIHTGWAYSAFNTLGQEVTDLGGLRVSMIDTHWKGSLRQIVGLLVFRILYRTWFDSVLVPGKAGRKFCRMLGMPNRRIFEGMYSAPAMIFDGGGELAKRSKRILFVGRFIERKGFRALIRAAIESGARHDGFEFVLMGEGPLRYLAESHSNIRILPFSTPDVVADQMKQARFLILPSLDENWGVVVHEAVSCGCGLLLSNKVGAAPDFCTPINAKIFPPNSPAAILRAIDEVRRWDDRALSECEKVGRQLAKKFSPSVFSGAVLQIIKNLNINFDK